MNRAFAMGQLRHLYAQMVNGHVKNCKEAASGLLGPAIVALEEADKSDQFMIETLNQGGQNATRHLDASVKDYNESQKRVAVLERALQVLCKERCPACPGNRATGKDHDVRCWLGCIISMQPGDPAYEAACAAIMEER
jgi:hypothetical protein